MGASSSTSWVPLGPAPLASDASVNGMQNYNWVSGRATSVVIDPADTSGNTVLLGGAYGGLWRSTNAGSLSPDPNPGAASVVWNALIDDQPTLAVGAIALQPGNSAVILVGTGETNNSADSYYGLGILRSTNGGTSWTQITGIGETPDEDKSFEGIGFSKIAFSTANPSVVVAATAGDNGLCLGEEAAAGGDNSPCLGPEEDGNSTVRGLYYSQNGGMSWNRAILKDGSVPASATSVIYNPMQGTNGTFYAFIRRHGLYASTDGVNFTPLAMQPGAGLASANCPTGSNATTCPIYRGELAMVPGRNEMYVWMVDVQPDEYGNPVADDEGIWQTINGGTSWTQIPDNGITNCGDSAFGPNSGCGVEQGWYNLALAAVPDATGTDIYAGAINLYKCTLEPAASTVCTQGDWINLTHADGCSPLAAPAHVPPSQHGIAFMVTGDTTPGYFAHDGGISRTLDGYSGLESGSCSGTNQFDSLSQTLGSMTEFVSVSVHPTNADILLGGTENNGSPKTSTATEDSTWQNALGGDVGFTAIDPTNPDQWFAANPYVAIFECDSATGTGTECNDSTFLQIVGPSDLGGDQGAYDTPYILDPQNTSEMLVGTCRVWQITTSGTAPVQLSNDFDTLGTGVCTGDEINLVNGLAAGGQTPNGYSSVVYAVTNGYGPLSASPGGEVWVTTNAGVTPMVNVTQNETQNVNPEGYAMSSVAMDTSDATGKTAYVGIMGFSTASYPTSHVWQTTNAGTSWMDWTGTGTTELPDAPVNVLLVDSSVTPSQIYAGTDVGVFMSSTIAPGWTEVDPTPGAGVSGFLPNAPVTALKIFSPPGTGIKTLVASTYGRGIWNYALAPDYTNAISNSPQTVFPTQTAVFNGTLTGASRIREPGEFELHGRGAGADNVHAESESDHPDCKLHCDGRRECGRLQLQRACGGNGPARDYAGRGGDAACGGLQFDGAQPECIERGAGWDIRAEHLSGDGVGKFCGDGDAQLSDGIAYGSSLRVLAIEFGEPDVIGSSDGYADGDGGAGGAGGWSGRGDDLGDDGGSAGGQETDVRPDGDGLGAGLHDCGDGKSQYDCGEPERAVERDADGGRRIQRERDADLYGGRSGDVHYAGAGDADGGRRSVYSDFGQRDGCDV